MRTLAVVVLCGLLAACGQATTPPPGGLTTSPIPGALPTVKPRPSGFPEACGGIGLQATLRGDQGDPHLAWLVNDLGTRVEIDWPPGYRARFVPGLEIVDASGHVVLRGGDLVTGACVTEDPDILHMEPPFR